MSIQHLVERTFWTPVITAELEDHDRISKPLEQAILKRHMEGGGEGPEHGAWQSNNHLLEWGGAAAQELRDIVLALAEEHTFDSLEESKSATARGWSCFAWANICGHGNYNRPHIHGDAYWTAVYYVRVDDGPGGELVLHDPRLPALDMHAPRLRFRPSGGEAAIHTTPEAGLLLLFPGWLCHSIAPYYGTGYRISVAMNIAARFGTAAEKDPSVLKAADLAR